jgi:tRNA A-37 threonylcarbamoyl transferase component Bud32
VQAGADIEHIVTGPIQADEHGYSGARLERHTITFRSPARTIQTTTLITKQASLTECRVLNHLTMQKQSVPFSHALDYTTAMPALVCQQDLRQSVERTLSPIDLQRKVARCLARVHHANLGRVKELSWVPRADRTYFEEVILADFREQLALAMNRPAFAARHGEVVRQMEEAIGPFLRAMDSLWAREYSRTLIHADMMDTHVLVYGDQPYLIDWGQARYGSLYLDLPNYLVPESIPYYRDALAELGLSIPEAEFTQCYGEAGRYPGFKYMGFLLHLSAAGQLDSLQGPLLEQLLHGSRRPYDPI